MLQHDSVIFAPQAAHATSWLRVQPGTVSVIPSTSTTAVQASLARQNALPASASASKAIPWGELIVIALAVITFIGLLE